MRAVMMMEKIEIQDGISISVDELEFSASRSGGPGGQNVNKVNTRVTIRFDVRKSRSFSEEQKSLILERLQTRISGEGILRVSSRRHRTQIENRRAAAERLIMLIQTALTMKPKRKKTRTPLSVRLERLEKKRRRGQIKRDRGKVTGEE